MRNQKFGLNINPDDVVLNLASNFPAAKSSTTTLIGNELYDTTYGIHNHDLDDPTEVYANVQMHWAEDCTSTSELYRAIESFIEFQVTAKTGLSLAEYLKLPRHVCVKIIDSCKSTIKKEATLTDDLLKTLDKGK